VVGEITDAANVVQYASTEEWRSLFECEELSI
jgi:hypothetical protein